MLELHEEVLVSIRQIIRAVDLRSKKLNRDFGLTSPQLLLLRSVDESGKQTIRQLSKQANMSQATATSILDRLEARELIVRSRDKQDKRKVHAQLTSQGKAVLAHAPQLLHQDVIEQLEALAPWEQTLLLSSLQRLSQMMNASDDPAVPPRS